MADATATASGGAGVGTPPLDPTTQTAILVQREISSVREIIEARLNGMDKAIELLQKSADKIPADIRAEVHTLQNLHAERFQSADRALEALAKLIATQFLERDVRTEQAATTTKVAVDAALQAQKEAVGEQNKSNAAAINKSEAAFAKQVEQISALITATASATDDKISDMKDRLTAIESIKRGGDETRSQNQVQSQSIGAWIFGGIGAVVGIGSLIALVISMTARTAGGP